MHFFEEFWSAAAILSRLQGFGVHRPRSALRHNLKVFVLLQPLFMEPKLMKDETVYTQNIKQTSSALVFWSAATILVLLWASGCCSIALSSPTRDDPGGGKQSHRSDSLESKA